MDIGNVPGPVVFAYMIAFLAPSAALGFQREVTPAALPQLPLQKKGPYSNSKDREVFFLSLKPAVCYNCRRVIGNVEGGLLKSLCHRCKPGDLFYYQRISAVNQMLGEGWGTDSLAAIILGEVFNIRNKETNNEAHCANA